jgi:TolA-binding protein
MTVKRSCRLGSLALLVGVAAPGCATKHDIRDLQSQLVLMQARQDSLFRIAQRQSRELLDSVRVTTDLLVRVRGELGHQLLGVEQQLVAVQELTGQSQRRLQDLNTQLQQRQEALATAPVGDSVSPGAPPPASQGVAPRPGPQPSAEELYALGQAQLQNGASSTARLAFQQLLRSYPGDTLGAAAQLGIADSYVKEDVTRALREFDRVVEQYPSSPRAPAALFRAGGLQRDRGNVARAREYFQRILARYPKSAEAAQARRELDRLRRR